MFWIDQKDMAHYVNSMDEISEDEYKNNFRMLFTNPLPVEINKGRGVFLVVGIGKYSPGIFEIVLADTLEECEKIISLKYKQRILEKTLYMKYYKIALSEEILCH